MQFDLAFTLGTKTGTRVFLVPLSVSWVSQNGSYTFQVIVCPVESHLQCRVDLIFDVFDDVALHT